MASNQYDQQTQQWAAYQLNQLMQFYPNVQLHSRTPDMDQYRVPLTLSVSKTPLYIRIDMPKQFPVVRPNLIVLAKVIHDEVHPRTKVISNPMLDNWDIFNKGSLLMNVVRDVHARFDAKPPMPEKMVQQPQQQQAIPKGLVPQLGVVQQESSIKEEIVPDREPKKSESILDDLKKIKGESQKIEKDIHAKLVVLEKTELEYIKDNHDYKSSFAFQMPQVLKVEALHLKAQDLCKEMADANKNKQEQIDSYTQTNQELQYEFEEKQDELKELYERYKSKKKEFQKDALADVLQKKAKDLDKESQPIAKAYRKGELGGDDYVKQYIAKRKEFHAYNYAVNAMKTNP